MAGKHLPFPMGRHLHFVFCLLGGEDVSEGLVVADDVDGSVTEALVMAKVVDESVTEALVVAKRHVRDRGELIKFLHSITVRKN